MKTAIFLIILAISAVASADEYRYPGVESNTYRNYRDRQNAMYERQKEMQEQQNRMYQEQRQQRKDQMQRDYEASKYRNSSDSYHRSYDYRY